MRRRPYPSAFLLTLALAACVDGAEPNPDAGSEEGRRDAGPGAADGGGDGDAGDPDAAVDAGSPDAAVDAGTTDAAVDAGLPDGDNDGVADDADNCPSHVNADQADADEDGEGDVCDPCPSVADLASICGDGMVCPDTETCDDGFTDACGTCNADCSGAGSGSSCGDGARCEETEACDDGFTDACGSCNADCSGAGGGSSCGDEEVCPETESCDDGYQDACGSCNADCSGAGSGSSCGDEEVCPETESCDDGYQDACGSCNATCSGAGSGSSCGDEEVCPETEACDDGFEDACGSCNADCTASGSGSSCGDGERCEETEACDDGDASDCGSCNALCDGAGLGDAPAGACADSVEGIFAVRVELDVWWEDERAPPLFDPGRGTIVVHAMADVSEVACDGDVTSVEWRSCGLALPVWRSAAYCDSFQLGFADSIWDEATMPTFLSTGTRGAAVGDDLAIAPLTRLLGISLYDVDGAWPTAAQTGTFTCPAGTGASCFPDHDGDALPGITADLQNIGATDAAGGPCGLGGVFDFVYQGMPLEVIISEGTLRAESLEYGVRLRTGAAAIIGDGCDGGTDSCVAENLDQRAWDCARTDGMACVPAQAQFVDESLMAYAILAAGNAPPDTVMVPSATGGAASVLDQTPSVGPRSAIVRLGASSGSFDCSDVRGASFPAFD